MGTHFPDEVSSPAEARSALFSDVFFSRGWSQQLPTACIEIMGALVLADEPPTRAQIEEHLRRREELKNGWDSPAWDELHQWTDEELRDLDEHFEGDPVFGNRDDEPKDATGVIAEEAEHRAKHLAAMDGYSVALSVAPVRTMGDLLDFMVACGVLAEQGTPDETRYEINPAAPLPSEVLPLSNEERAAEDRRRWADLHEPTAQKIIELFHDDEDEPNAERRRTSLQRLAREIGTDVESARAGVLNLLQDGDFTATVDVERAAEHKVFELVVDWDRFHATRIQLRFA